MKVKSDVKGLVGVQLDSIFLQFYCESGLGLLGLTWVQVLGPFNATTLSSSECGSKMPDINFIRK